MGFDDFSTQRKAEAGAGLFGRVKRQKRFFHRVFVHARAVVRDMKEGAVAGIANADHDARIGFRCFDAVFDKIDQQLAKLGDIAETWARRQWFFDRKLRKIAKIRQQIPPVDVALAGFGQARELRISIDELHDMAEYVLRWWRKSLLSCG